MVYIRTINITHVTLNVTCSFYVLIYHFINYMLIYTKCIYTMFIVIQIGRYCKIPKLH